MWRVVRRFFWEFGPSFAVAICWAIISAWPFQGDWLRGFVANLGGAFFFVSWMMGQFVRIGRQQATEDTLGTLVGTLTGVAEKLDSVKNRVDAFGSDPALQSLAKEISDLTSSANTQLAQANSTASAALSQIRGLPWASNWELPPRPPVNPAIYSFGSAPPAPLLHDEQAKKGDK
jgi:hypothetical protein